MKQRLKGYLIISKVEETAIEKANIKPVRLQDHGRLYTCLIVNMYQEGFYCNFFREG